MPSKNSNSDIDLTSSSFDTNSSQYGGKKRRSRRVRTYRRNKMSKSRRMRSYRKYKTYKKIYKGG